MSNSKHEWNEWLAAPVFQARRQEAVKRHRDAHSVSLADHIKSRHAELACELQGKKLIYLDTKHWVSLCLVVTQCSQAQPVYGTILKMLESLRQEGRICCPVSSTLFDELMKQTDRVTRLATARIMDFLSGGVCIQNWLFTVELEFTKHVCRTLRAEEPELLESSSWTKAGYWAGEDVMDFCDLSSQEALLLSKVCFDMRWDMTFEDYQTMPDWVCVSDFFADAWVNQSANCGGFAVGNQKPQFRDLVQKRRLTLIKSLSNQFADIFEMVCQNVAGNRQDHVNAVLEPVYEGRDQNALPSIEILAGLDAALVLERTRKVQANDMLDYFHAAHALPYCDALFCDNFMAHKMRTKPLEFGKIYNTEIGSRPEELLAYLKHLAGGG